MGHVQALYGGQRMLLTRAQVAEILGCSPRTVARLVERGELRQVHVGRLARFRPLDVDALVDRSLKDDECPPAEAVAVKTSAERGRRHEGS
jgi:excisionase family DNA binding protein